MLNGTLQAHAWTRWSAALMVEFPLMMLVLGEAMTWLKRIRSPFLQPLRVLSFRLLLVIVVWLLVEQVPAVPRAHIVLRGITTLVSILMYLPRTGFAQHAVI